MSVYFLQDKIIWKNNGCWCSYLYKNLYSRRNIKFLYMYSKKEYLLSMYKVIIQKRAEKQIRKLRLIEKKKFVQLFDDLREF